MKELEKFLELDNIIRFLKTNIFKLFIIFLIVKIGKIFKTRIEKILKIILKNVKEDIGFETQKMEESILNSITIKRELYREKRVNLLNDEIKKVYLGDIELVLQGYYGKMLLIFLQYVKYVGVGEFREYGFGEIILRS